MEVSKPCRSYRPAYAVAHLSVLYPSYIQKLERPPRGRNRRIVTDILSPRAKLSRGPGGRTRRRTRRYSHTRGGAIESIGNNYIELFGRILLLYRYVRAIASNANMSRPPRSPSPGDAEELALLRGITKQVCAENDTCSPETMKENNVLAKLKQWYHTGKIDEAQWRMRTEVILDASMKRAGFVVEDATPPSPKQLKSTETMPSRASKSSLKSRSSSDGEVDDEQYKVGNPGPSKRACDTHSEIVVRDKKLCDAACKFENHVGTKIVVIDANEERQV